MGDEYVVRGTWERKTAEWLNENDILWKRRIYISYTLEGKERTYTPDFFLPNENLYLEVKGYFSEIDKKKIDVVSKIIPIKLVFKKHLDRLKTISTIDELLGVL